MLRRVIALVLSWLMPASTVWASAPPVTAPAEPVMEAPLRGVLFGFPIPPEEAAPGAQDFLQAATPGEAQPAREVLLAALERAMASQGRPDQSRGPQGRDDQRRDDQRRDDRDDSQKRGDDRNDADRDGDDQYHEGHHCVRPILVCVSDRGHGRYTAHFGYRNDHDGEISIPAGPDNRIEGGGRAEHRGQTVRFRPGRFDDHHRPAFDVDFDGSELTWTLRGPDRHLWKVKAWRHSPRCGQPEPPPVALTCEESFFGPKRYTRTTGRPDVFSETITVPSWVTSPWVLRVVNGEADGRHRVSSATIEVNGTTVARQSDLNQNVAGFDRAVTLTPTTTLKVTLGSAPGSFLTLSFCGALGDKTAPLLTVAAPPAGAVIPDATPDLLVQYSDPVGSSEPVASGVDTDTLEVWLDGVDRTSLFTRRPGDASATVPEALPEGRHQVKAAVKDRAGNRAEVTSEFRVDVTAPQLVIVTPAQGAYLNTEQVPVRVTYLDPGGDLASGLDLGTLRILVNGTDRSSLFEKGAAEAVGQLLADQLVEGANEIRAEIRDVAGNLGGPVATAFNYDRTPPDLVITQPSQDATLGSATVEAIVSYQDAQGLDLPSFRFLLDGGEVVPFERTEDGAKVTLGPLAPGSHTLQASIRDRATNQTTTPLLSFRIDTEAPSITVVVPEAGAKLRDARPFVRVEYHDDQGIDTTTLVVRVNGEDRTGLFAIGESEATATLADALPEGPNRITAEVKDEAGNPASSPVNEFVVDTQAPLVAIEAPPALTNQVPPQLRVSYSDPAPGTGVDTRTLQVLLDGVDRTALVVAGPDGAVGTLAFDPPLADGAHLLEVSVSDLAGNPSAVASRSFTLDATEPEITVLAPVPNSFISQTTPELRVNLADVTSGVDPASLHFYLRHADEAEVEVPGVALAGDLARAPVPAPLADGTWRLRVVVSDQAGNARESIAIFEVDSVPPTFTVEAPAAGFINTATPALRVSYQDDRSGIDTARFRLRIDTVDLTERLTVEPRQAAGTVADALAETEHVLAVELFDGAGNAALPSEHRFVIDIQPPQAQVVTPADGSYLGAGPGEVRASYQDSPGGSGIDPASVLVFIDEVDRTGAFTVGAQEAVVQLDPPLADGPHTVRVDVQDRALNPKSASSSFVVDTAPPQVAIAVPALDGSYVRQSPVQVSGTVQDSDPQTIVECQVGTQVVPATVSDGGFTCSVPLAEGENAIRAVARDRFGREGEDTRHVTLDSTPPQVTISDPADQSATSQDAIPVSGHVVDASPVTVEVGGVAASVSGDTFTAAEVPIGNGTITAIATDAAGNTGQAVVHVRKDTTAPQVTITSPAAGAYLRGPSIEVQGTLSDEGGATVFVNDQQEDSPSSTPVRTFSARVPAADGLLELLALGIDEAGNRGTSAPVTVHIDSQPPLVAVSAPGAGLVTRAETLLVQGDIQDASPMTLSVGGAAPRPIANGPFAEVVPLGPANGLQTILLVARDEAENEATYPVTVLVDRAPPEVSIASPAEGEVLLGLPVWVQGTVRDVVPECDGVAFQCAVSVSVRETGTGTVVEATVTGEAWQASFDSLPEGPLHFAATARDTAGNEASAERSAMLGGPIEVAITSPLDGTLTRFPTITVSGSVSEGVQSVTVNGIAAVLNGTLFTATGVPVDEGVDQPVTAEARRGTQTATATVRITRDATPPYLALETPDRITASKPGQAVATATDAIAFDRVEIYLDGAASPVAVFTAPTAPPFVLALSVAEGDVIGTTRTVRAVAYDEAGNQREEQRAVKIGADGAVVGQVLSDVTGLPIAEATAELLAEGASRTAKSDSRGRYAFPASEASGMVRVSWPNRTSVEREVPVEDQAGTVLVDARLTPLAQAETIGPEEGELAAGLLSVFVPAGAVVEATSFRLTRLSGQGLPGLLPLGWSPIGAFDLQAAGDVSGALPGILRNPTVPADESGTEPPAVDVSRGVLPEGPVTLARYQPSLHAWMLVSTGHEAVDGALAFDLPGAGSYVLVVPDAEPAPALPEPGQALTGVAMVLLPSTETAAGEAAPPTLPPSDGQAAGRLRVDVPVLMPSGTVVQAEVTEEYALTGGDTASTEVRQKDILLYRTAEVGGGIADCTGAEGLTRLCGEFPIVPSRGYSAAELQSGNVHLDILSGRESVRGKLGGQAPLQIADADVTLQVPGQALAENTAIALVVATSLSGFLPTTADVVPISELVLDFSGSRLGQSAVVSIGCQDRDTCTGAACGVADTCTALSGGTGERVVFARVEREATGSVPRLEAVAIGELADGRIVTQPLPGSGITEEGRYVAYRVTTPLGFVGGTTTSSVSGSTIAAVVEGAGLPFVALSKASSGYLLPAKLGPVQVKAYVTGTTLNGEGTADVSDSHTATAPFPLPLLLDGVATTATVYPEEGALVSVGTYLELNASAPLRQDPDFSTKVSLTQHAMKDGESDEPVSLRFQLSGSGTRLSILPMEKLAPATRYTLAVTGLLDASEGAVVVSGSTFTTKASEAIPFDLDSLAFSYPKNGEITISAPPGSLPPFSEVLVINGGNGDVATFTVLGDGSLDWDPPLTIRGSINDRLMITVADPLGNTTTFERSKFVELDENGIPTGKVAIGPGGGTVDDPATGAALFVPPGATDAGVELKVVGLTPEQLEERFPGEAPVISRDPEGNVVGYVGGGLEITSKDQPTFKKEVDLVFPLPNFENAPEGERPARAEDAFYYVLKRLEGPCKDPGQTTCEPEDREVMYLTVDTASVQCPPGQTTCEESEKRVATASYPFEGYTSSFGGFGFGPAGFFASAVETTMVYLMWTASQDGQAKSLAGVVTGKVLETVWDPDATTPTYRPVGRAFVTGVDAGGQRLMSGGSFGALSQGSDGTYTLWDPTYSGGTVRVAATRTGADGTAPCVEGAPPTSTLACGVAYEGDAAVWSTTGLSRHSAIATANLIFPATEPPPPPPAIAIRVFRIENGERVDTQGLVSGEGVPLLIVLTPTAGTIVQGVRIQGGVVTAQAEGSSWIVQYQSGKAGTYRVEATGLRAGRDGPEAVPAATTFRVLGAGGPAEIDEDDPPSVIAAQTVPKDGATGVPVGAFVQIVFTEPVKNLVKFIAPNLVQYVELRDPEGQAVRIKISGIGRNGEAIDNLTSENEVVTGITVQPLEGLRYKTTYRLTLSNEIRDLDSDPEHPPAEKRLVNDVNPSVQPPYATSFETFGPESLIAPGEGVTFGSPSIVVLGERAYLMDTSARLLRAFDVTDPVSPTEIETAQHYVPNYGRDIAGEAPSPLGERVVAVTTTPILKGPTGTWLFDVSEDGRTRQIGGVTLLSSHTEGYVYRTFMYQGFLYAGTHKRGILAVDLATVAEDNVPEDSAEYRAYQGMHWKMTREGSGWSTRSIVSIPVAAPGGPARLQDVEAALLTNLNDSRIFAVATGDIGLAVADPSDPSGPVFSGPVLLRAEGGTGAELGRLSYGTALGLTKTQGHDIAVVAGSGMVGGQSTPLILIVNLDNARAPVGMGHVVGETGWVTDVVVKDDVAYIAYTDHVMLLSLTDLTQPRITGTIPNIGGRLAFGENGALLFGTAKSAWGGDTELGGVRTAALTAEALARLTRPAWVEDPDMRGCTGCENVGAPVNVTTGNVLFDQADGVVAGIHGLAFTRSYNSRNAYRRHSSLFGPGWSHSYEVRVSEPEEKAIALEGPDGVPMYFRDGEGTGTYQAFLPASERSWFVKSSIANVTQYTRRFLDGSFEIYDGSGRLTRRVDALEQSTTLEWDTAGRLTVIKDPGGRMLVLTYDGEGHATRLSAGSTTLATYAYDGKDRLASVTYADGSGYSFTYDDLGQVLSVKDLSGRTLEEHAYDGEGRALTSEVADGQEKLRLSYENGVTKVVDARNQLTSFNWRQVKLLKVLTNTESGGAATGFGYDAKSRVRSATDAAGGTSSFSYDAQGNLASQRSPSGFVTSGTYDTRGRPLTVKGSDGSSVTLEQSAAGPTKRTALRKSGAARVTTMAYDPRGKVTSVTDPRGKTTTFVWNTYGDLVSVTNPAGTTSYEYDELGRRTKVTDPLGHATSFSYDGRGHLLRTTYADETHTDYTYDKGGRRLTAADTLGRTTSYSYDGAGRLESTTDPAAAETRCAYDAMSNLASLTDAMGNTNAYMYDQQQRLIRTTDPRGAVESYTYDAAGTLLTKTDRRGVVTTYAHDSGGRLTGKAYSDGTPAVSYSYDESGRMLTASNGGDSLTWTYDLTGEMLTETSGKNATTLSMSYDAGGNRTALKVGEEPLLSYGYDDASRLTGITQGARTFTLNYDAASRRTSVVAPNGITSTYTLDNMSRLEQLTHGAAAQAAYSYDTLGNRTSKTIDGVAESYSYDALSRLRTATRPSLPAQAFDYDAVGNRTSAGAPPDVTMATYGQGNQLSATTGADAADYTYDANGNLLSKIEAGSTWAYEWTAENELKRVTKDDVEIARFAYDPLGRRVERIAGGITYSYLYDGQDILKETRSDGTVYTYVHGPGIDEPLARIDATDSVTYYHADGLGSIVATTDAAGGVTSRRQYDAWGNLEQGADQPGYAFTGREWDPETGLYYYRARYYDPKVGRFISEDPIGFGDGLNVYAYAHGAPTVWADPLGLAVGHHYVPKEVYRAIPGLSEDAMAFFSSATSGGPIPGGVHSYDAAHRAYSARVASLWTQWAKSNNINPRRMTAAKANKFLQFVAKDARANRYLRSIHRALGTRLASRLRCLGRFAKVLAFASIASTLMNEGAEAAVEEAADALAWPVPISDIQPQTEGEHEYWVGVGRTLGGNQE